MDIWLKVIQLGSVFLDCGNFICYGEQCSQNCKLLGWGSWSPCSETGKQSHLMNVCCMTKIKEICMRDCNLTIEMVEKNRTCTYHSNKSTSTNDLVFTTKTKLDFSTKPPTASKTKHEKDNSKSNICRHFHFRGLHCHSSGPAKCLG
ncbi:uncharacterized protein LOC111133138 [Crassostrea virginica]